jgi:hypothetical protein
LVAKGSAVGRLDLAMLRTMILIPKVLEMFFIKIASKQLLFRAR